MCLVAVDAHPKWPEVMDKSTTTASLTVTVLRRMFSANGLPKQLVTDNGLQFVSEEFASFCQANGIKHIHVSTYNMRTSHKETGMLVKKNYYIGLILLHFFENLALWECILL